MGEQKRSRNHPIRHCDSITSSRVLLSRFTLSYCTTALMDCPQTQWTSSIKVLFQLLQNTGFSPCCSKNIHEEWFCMMSPINYTLFTFQLCQLFLGCRIDFLHSRHTLVSVHLLEIGNPSHWTLLPCFLSELHYHCKQGLFWKLSSLMHSRTLGGLCKGV